MERKLKQLRPSTIVASCKEFEQRYPKGLDQAASILATPFGRVCKHREIDARFPDGEAYSELPEFEKGAPVFLFQALVGDAGVGPDSTLIELMIASRAYKQFGAGPVTAVVPFLAYSRQDRYIIGERRPVTSRLIADLFSAAGIDRVLAIQSGSCSNLRRQFTSPRLQQVSFVRYMEECAKEYDRNETILVAPDAGALDDVKNVASRTGHQFLSVEKMRLGPETVEVRNDRVSEGNQFTHALILDDLVSSAGTVKAAFESLRQIGFESFSIAAPHCRLTQTGSARLDAFVRNGELIRFHTTDTISANWSSSALQIAPFMTTFSPELERLMTEPFEP